MIKWPPCPVFKTHTLFVEDCPPYYRCRICGLYYRYEADDTLTEIIIPGTTK